MQGHLGIGRPASCVFVGVVLAACVGPNGHPVEVRAPEHAVAEQAAPPRETSSVDKNDRLPAWVVDPGLGGVVGAVGVASSERLGTADQLDAARRNARLELASMLEVRVQAAGRSELQDGTHLDGQDRTEESRESRVDLGRDICDTVLAGTRQRALWFDPETAECYVWLVLDGRVLQSVEHRVVDAISVFVATEPVSGDYRPEPQGPRVPAENAEGPEGAGEAPSAPLHELEQSLQQIGPVPIEKQQGGRRSPRAEG